MSGIAQERTRSRFGFTVTQQQLSQMDPELLEGDDSGADTLQEARPQGAAPSILAEIAAAPSMIAPAMHRPLPVFHADPDPGRRQFPARALPIAPQPAAAAPQGTAAAPSAADAELKYLRTLYPALGAMPDNMLLRTDLATLTAINNSMLPQQGHNGSNLNLAEVAAQAAAAAAAHMGLANHMHREEDPGLSMARSLETLTATPVAVPAGNDDRSAILHPARFLGGAVCSVKRVWRAARDALGLEGPPALANYDLQSIGLGGTVTARGWKEIHNPASMNITVKLFSPSNMASSTGNTKRLSLVDGERSINVGESLKEVTDLEELKLAVRAMCRAAQLALPWNQSFNAIEGFLHSSDWARAELSGRSNRAGLLADFVNYILGINAQAWQQKEDFKSSGEIKVLWSEWFSSRPASLLASIPADNNHQQNNHGGGSGNRRRPGRGGFQRGYHHGGQHAAAQGGNTANLVPPYPPPASGATGGGGRQKMLFCHKFNNGSCPNQASACALPSGTRLHHLCDALNSQGFLCKQNHARVNHK